jgi:hypothetical protein
MIRIVIADPFLRGYVEECLRRIPDIAIVDGIQAPDLVVTNLDFGDSAVSELPSLHVLNEAPDATSEMTNAIDFILMPFDARTLAHAVSRALHRGRQPP